MEPDHQVEWPDVSPPGQPGSPGGRWRPLIGYARAAAESAIDMRKCSCGEEFLTPEDLEAHHADRLAPNVILGKDGYFHAEIFKDCPIPEYPLI